MVCVYSCYFLQYNTVFGELEKARVDLHHHKSGIKRLQKLNSQVLTQVRTIYSVLFFVSSNYCFYVVTPNSDTP